MFGEAANTAQLVLELLFCGRTHLKTVMDFIRAHFDLEHETEGSIWKFFLTRTHKFPVNIFITYVTIYFCKHTNLT
jgi:hypothetical protein